MKPQAGGLDASRTPERHALARLRFANEQTRGRRYPELPHPYRTEFQRDRDRVIHSRAFRRLENKTQVFAPGVSDHFRNRLTHTMEVAQIARTVASVLQLNEDFTEALALGHDVGHPPFGHAGEDALDRQMRRFGMRFDHNLHALRIVETFEQRYARFPGLNLLFEVREGIVKHSRDYAPGEDAIADEYLPALRPPLEAQLIDLADEIAYNTADLDDAFSALLITRADIRDAVPAFAALDEDVQSMFPGAPERVQFLEALRGTIDLLVSGLVNGTAHAAEAAGVSDSEEVRLCPQRLAAFTSDAAHMSAQLKSFLRSRVYYSEALVDDRERSAEQIEELFTLFLAHPDKLPEGYREAAQTHAPHVVICDYIAGMTDGFFERSWRALCGGGTATR